MYTVCNHIHTNITVSRLFTFDVWEGARYWAGVIRYGLIRFLVSKNHMIENRILSLSPIGKKLGEAPMSYGRHLGF